METRQLQWDFDKKRIMEDSLVIGFSGHFNDETTVLLVGRKNDDEVTIINEIKGPDAVALYNKLTEGEIK